MSTSQYVIPLPGPGMRQVAFAGDFPLTEAEWEHVASVLEAMKPGLVVPRDFAAAAPADPGKE